MTDTSTPARSKRTIWIVAAVAAIAVAGVVVWGIATGWWSDDSSTANPATPGASASPQPTGSPSNPAPEETESAETDAEVEPRATNAPVPLDQPAEPVPGLGVSLVGIESIDGVAAVPGEISGPAIQVTVRLANTTTNEVLLDAPIVNMYFGAESSPANILVNPREDLPSVILPGETIDGVYAFTVPADQRGRIVIEADLGVDLPVLIFEGAL